MKVSQLPAKVWGRLSGLTLQMGGRILSSTWQPYSRLFFASDGFAWVLSWESREVSAVARSLGINVADSRWVNGARKQSIFYSDQYFLNRPELLQRGNRVGFAYFHGRPFKQGDEFSAVYETFRRNHERVSRVQVSNSVFRDVVLESGIAPEKVHLIPIGINLDFFSMQTAESRRAARAKYGIPESAVTVGSFQKDGSGWGEGMEPKLIKGPDVFVKTIRILKDRIPELFVVLSGPARGYVKKNLNEMGVPYKHLFLDEYPEIGKLFQTLDLYIIASRDEGGPKAILESMASGVPLVTTRVGQAVDLVKHGDNGWMVESEDIEGLAHWSSWVLQNRGNLTEQIASGRKTAESNCYQAQSPAWRKLFTGFVEF